MRNKPEKFLPINLIFKEFYSEECTNESLVQVHERCSATQCIQKECKRTHSSSPDNYLSNYSTMGSIYAKTV